LNKIAPESVRSIVASILDSESKYVDLKKLEQVMLKRDWNQINETNKFIDSHMLVRDIKNG
jgi:hypothetical protein